MFSNRQTAYDRVNKQGGQRGFSLIEVLVASSILLMIMMMLGMIFQQSSQAWRTGTRRADMYAQIRGYFGAIQRDASCAVDEKTVPHQLRQLLGGASQSFSDPLRFYTLAENGFKNDTPSDGLARRSLTFVEYNKLRRTEKKLYVDATGATKIDPQSGTPQQIASDVSVESIQALTWDGQNMPAGDFPAFVTVRASVNSQRGMTLEIGAGSAGVDRTWNTKDDIATWVK
jgi:prepilin-type N-terminal cleavage/methylation domain-containing protein